MKFMATQRSNDDHARLRVHLFSCRCSLHNHEVRQLHRPAPPAVTVEDKFETVLFYLCRVLATAMALFNRKLHDANRRWPISIDDLNPFSAPPRQLCDTILKWAADPSSGYAAFTLIGALAVVWPSVERHVFSTPAIFTLATAHLEYTLNNIPTHNANDLWIARFSSPVFACAGNLFHTLARNRPYVADAILRSGIQSRMHAIALRMQPLLDPKGEGDMADSCAWFAVVCARAGGTFVARGSRAAPVSNAERGYFYNAWEVMVTMRSSKCTRAGCASETAPQDSRVCSQCGVARYCGREHQRDAWKSETRPHKWVCEAIQMLRRAIHMEDPVAWTRLIHDTDSERAPFAFKALYERYDVHTDLGKNILLAAGWPL
ncbi:hypothetical protein B0H19DRAFT_710532 [Mycena capillaripes]|nr:hypothetical protein B0H19DRAFT_710532 [Mycena capillaripes]